MEDLYKKYKSRGFAVLGFPANQFGNQEPGTNGEIKDFCSSKYHVDFPMFSKVVVKGDGIDPLYQWLVSSGPRHEDVEWNFAKFLVGRDGQVVGRYLPKIEPNNADLVKDIEAALDKK